MTPSTLIEFWFGPGKDDAATAGQQAALWWRKNPDIDAEIRRRFEPSLQAADNGQLDDWATTPQGRLALILLTDQFPRNMYRDTPQAFKFDPKARELCIDGLELGMASALRPIQRVFFYLPLEHSEDADHQTWCVNLMRSLASEVPEDWKPTFDAFVEYAVAHQRIIDRFGRYPHRNAILGRESSDEERAFLQQPGSSF